jgi:hypothetical protein
MRLNRMKPRPNRVTPVRITPCAPKRSMNQPITGPSTAASSWWIAAAPESSVFDQPRSSRSTAK